MIGLAQTPLVGDIEIRLARPEDRLRWDRLMAEGHELGFLRFVGRGLRSVAVLGTLWVALAGWQAGALKCRPRDRCRLQPALGRNLGLVRPSRTGLQQLLCRRSS